MFWSVYGFEQKKILQRAMLWIEICILSGIIILSIVAMAASNPPADIVQRQIVWPMALVVLLRQFAANSLITGALIVTLSGTIMAQEYSWRSINTIFSRGIPRLSFLAAKFAALLLPILLIVLFPMLLGMAVSGFYTFQFNHEIDFHLVNFFQVVISILYGAYALLPYAALAILLAVIGRSVVLAIGGGIGFLILEMMVRQYLNGLGQAGLSIAKWFPMSLSMSMLRPSQGIAYIYPVGSAGMDIWKNLQLPSTPIAALVILFYVVLCLGIAGSILKRQDLGG